MAMYEKQLFERFNDLNVLIVGDVMIDRYLIGQVDRISPEAPVPIVLQQSMDNRFFVAFQKRSHVCLGERRVMPLHLIQQIFLR